jgi:DNA-binding NarL/FixJ family response regulator
MRVVIADDTPLMRQGIARLLTEAGIAICGEAGDAHELLELVTHHQPDVAVVDIRMPPTHTDEGLAAADAIRKSHRQTGVLVLSQYVEPSYALRLLDGGECRSGYLLKDNVLHAEQLIAALERIAAGGTVVDPALVEALLDRRRNPDPLSGLTDREREVLGLIAEGLTDRGIAARLWLTPRTIETHVRHILRKLDLPAGAAHNRRVHAVLTYLRS